MQMLNLDDGRTELRQKSLLDIERETAITWGGRAVAAFSLAKESAGEERTNWLRDAENYRQESLEHAAMTEDIGFLGSIIAEIDRARDGTVARR